MQIEGRAIFVNRVLSSGLDMGSEYGLRAAYYE